jgi:hypothetical protein
VAVPDPNPPMLVSNLFLEETMEYVLKGPFEDFKVALETVLKVGDRLSFESQGDHIFEVDSIHLHIKEMNQFHRTDHNEVQTIVSVHRLNNGVA